MFQNFLIQLICFYSLFLIFQKGIKVFKMIAPLMFLILNKILPLFCNLHKLGLYCPRVKNFFVFNLFFLTYESSNYKVKICEIGKFMAQIQRDARFQYVYQFFPKP